MTDRARALALAVQMSKPRDIIVAAGKGHETYQITNAGTIHFDDKEHLTRACANALTQGLGILGISPMPLGVVP